MSRGGAPSRDLVIGAALFTLAFVLRLVTMLEVREIPSVETLIIDAASYDIWARRIAAGDWFGDTVFYQAPAYPYLMAIIYFLPGPDVWALRLAQAAMGATACALTFATTRTLFGRAAGLAAGGMLAIYAPAIFFDGIVQKTSLGLLLTSTTLWLLISFQERRRLLQVGLAGLVLGLLALTRENALILVPVVGAWLLLRFRGTPWPKRLVFVALFAAGVLSPLFGVAWRNHVVGDSWALTTSQLGTNFWYGNNPDASGGYVPLLPGRHTPAFEAPDSRYLAEQALGRELTAGEVSDYWLERGLAFAREEPGAWLQLTLRKALFVWNDFEMPDTEDIYVYAEWSWVLRITHALLGFGLLAPLAAVGLALAWRTEQDRRDSWLLPVLALTYAAGVTLFLVLARFRFPLVPLMLPFAGLAVARIVVGLRERRFRRPLVPLLAFLAMAVISNWPMHDRDALRATSYVNYSTIEISRGELEPAERYLTTALKLAPQSGDIRFHLGVVWHRQGRLADAARILRAQLERVANDHRAHLLLSTVLEQQGKRAEAAYHQQMGQRFSPRPLDPEPAR